MCLHQRPCARAEAQAADMRLTVLEARIRDVLRLPSEHRISMMELVGAPSESMRTPADVAVMCPAPP